MRKIVILFILCLCSNSNLYGAYDETVLKDMGTNTPLGTENPGVLDDKLRQLSRLLETQYHEKLLTVSGTVTATDTFVIGSSSTAILCSFPSASSVANGTTTKLFVVKNRGAGTMTLSPLVDGVGSPTVSQNRAMTLFTDGTSWFEIRSENAGDAATLGGLSSGSYARSGANSDITAITGLTTYLAVGQGGSGTNTAAGAASAFGVGTEDTPTLTGIATTGSSTLTTVTIVTGTISSNLGITGTVTGLTDGMIPNTVTLDNVTQITTRSLSDMQNTVGLATQTSGLLSFATQTTGLLSIATQTSGLLSLATQTTGLLSFGTQTTGLLSFGTQTTGLLSLATQTSNLLSYATQTTGLLSLATQTTGNYLQSWTTGSQTTAATGTVRFNSTGDIVTSSTYDGNGNGTITTALSAGVSAKPDAQVDSVTQVSNPTAYDFPGAFVSIAGSGTAAAITFKKPSLATQTSGLLSFATQTTGLVSLATQTSGLASLGTQTNGLLSFATQTTGLVSFGTQTTGLVSIATQTTGVAFSDVTGSATQAQLPTILQLKATTTTTLTADSNGYLRLTTAAASVDEFAKLILHGNGVDASTVISNNSASGIVVSAFGNAQIDTAQSVFGGASILLDGTTDYLAGSDTASVLLNQDFQLDLRVRFNVATGAQDLYYHQTSGANLCNFQLTSGTLKFFVDEGGSTIVNLAYLWSPSINTWYALRVALDASENTYYLWVNGNLVRTLVDTDKPANYTGEFYFGRGSVDTESNVNGWLDEIILKVGTDSVTTTGTYTVTLSEYESPRWDTMRYIAPQGAVMLEFRTPGTSSDEKSYTFLNGSITVFGGTTTASIGSSTPGLVYGVPGQGASTFDAQNVHSVDEIKAGIENFTDQKAKLLQMNPKSWHPKVRDVYILDAEARAKDDYIRKDYAIWEFANKGSYTTSITMPGTGTVQVLDAEKMLQDFKAEKELSWASDLNQQKLIQATQDDLESDKSITRLGFRVRDPFTPKEVIEGETINLMSVITLAVDSIKSQQKEIGSLTAALENQKIAYNEEVDNLYTVINAIIVSLLAVGGVSGWATMRLKRKGT